MLPEVVLKKRLGLILAPLDGRTGTVFDSTNVRGVIVLGAAEGSPAQTAHLRRGDAIIKVDDVPIADTHNFAARVAAKKPGETVTLDYLRPGRTFGSQMVIQHVRAAVPVAD